MKALRLALLALVRDGKSGELRVLAVSGEERYPDGPLADIPTLTEEDVDLVFLNWRGVLAPPGISQERTDELIGYLQKMHDSQGWKDQLAEKGWTDDFKTGDDFAAFIDEQDERVSGTLQELGLL